MIITKIGYLLVKKSLKAEMDQVDYKKYGGAMLTGVNGIAIKAHGSSDAFSFMNALELAYNMVEADVLNTIKKEIK